MPEQPPNIDLYSRNGFAGPMATLVRSQYAPAYTRVAGTYTPRQLDLMAIEDRHFSDDRALPVPVLVGEGTSIEMLRRRVDMPFAVRNVFRDEVHYIYSGTARLETDFGVLDIEPGDFVLLPRTVTYRYTGIVGEVAASVLSTTSELRLEPENAPGVLNVDLHVEAPRPFEANIGAGVGGEYEVLLRHGDDTTSYFFDADPLPTMQVFGPPIVRRFNIRNVHGIGVTSGGLMPSRLLNDQTTNTLLFYLGTRQTTRPPIHHNADYDEIIFFARGPGAWGAVSDPGTVTWTPKGVIHHGPDENVSEGFQAFLVETRAAMRMTDVGAQISRLMEMENYGVHPTDRSEPAAHAAS